MEINNQSNKRKRDESEKEISTLELLLETKKICLDTKDIICPITKQIFCFPVTTDDGFTYEKWAADQMLSNKQNSPMTREPIQKYFVNKFAENLVNNFLNNNNEFKKLQFDNGNYIDYLENKKECHKFLNNKDFRKFCEYKDIILTDEFKNNNLIEYITIYCNDQIYFQKIIENSVDLNTPDSKGKYPMYYICKFGTENMIKYAISKEAEILTLNNDNDTAIHIIFQNTKLSREEKISVLKYFIDNNLINLYLINKKGISQLMKIIDNNNEVALYLIQKIIGGELENSEKLILELIDISIISRIVLLFEFNNLNNILDLLKKRIDGINKNIIENFYLNKFEKDLNELKFERLYDYYQ